MVAGLVLGRVALEVRVAAVLANPIPRGRKMFCIEEFTEGKHVSIRVAAR